MKEISDFIRMHPTDVQGVQQKINAFPNGALKAMMVTDIITCVFALPLAVLFITNILTAVFVKDLKRTCQQV